MKMGESGRTVNIGILGLGARGSEQIKVISSMPDVCIKAVCDVYEDRVKAAQDYVENQKLPRPDGETDADKVFERKDIEAVVIMTSWETHIELCVKAMEHGITPAMEVGGASSLDECWQLVRTSEKTGIPCMLLENCCYGKEEMTLLNMIRQGIFGQVVHCQGGYEHDLRDEIGNGDINRHYRQRHFLHRNAELYPTHELGPIAEYLNINRGNRMMSVVSMASKAAGLHAWLEDNRKDAPDLIAHQVNEGDVVTTMIKCFNGETIVLIHDCTLPRPYSRGGRVQGTKGIWMEDNRSIYIDGRTPKKEGYWTHVWESDAPYMKEYEHPLWKEYEEFGERGGHGGMDYLALRAFFEAIQQGTDFPIDVYDAASWMAVTVLSEQSIATGSAPVPFPDFTDGKWTIRKDKAQGPYKLGLDAK